MSDELEKWRYPRFFSDIIDEEHGIIYMNDEDSKHIVTVLRLKTGDKAIVCDKKSNDYLCELSSIDAHRMAQFSILEKKKNEAEQTLHKNTKNSSIAFISPNSKKVHN